MIATRQHIVLNAPVKPPAAARRSHVQALMEDAKTYSIEDLNVSVTLMLDVCEEYEERLSRIENCLSDLCLALRGFVSDIEFSKLKKQVDSDSPVQGSAESRADERSTTVKEDRPALRKLL